MTTAWAVKHEGLAMEGEAAHEIYLVEFRLGVT